LWGEVLLSLALKQMDDRGSETGEAVLSAAAGLQKLSPSERVPAICDAVIDIAAALFNVSGRELRHPGRSSLSVSRVRQIAMYVTHVALGLSMREVGQGFGRDRTTVLHACHQIEDLRDDQEFDGIVAMTERVMTAALGRAGQ
jgi:chromosomal replication initiation ATPase DnaA